MAGSGGEAVSQAVPGRSTASGTSSHRGCHGRTSEISLKQLLVPSESMVVSGGRTWISVPNGLSFSN